MKFEEIFKEDGLYKSKDFSKGTAFKVKNGELYIVSYLSEKDLLPTEDCALVYRGLFKKEYNKILTIKQLFNEKN